jgi:hypothetical protein
MSQQQLLPATTAELSPLQKGWLHMASIREQLFADLQSAELAVQGAINPVVNSADLAEVQTAITTAKSTMKEAKEKRLAFSRLIDEKLLTPAMEFEKRMASVIDGVAAHELDLRKKAAKEAEDKQAHAGELVGYRAHIVNENYRIAQQYRAELDREITATYALNLRSKVPADQVSTIISALSNSLPLVTVPAPNKFARKLVTDDEAREVIAATPKYDPSADLSAAINSLSERFANYEADLANSEAAAVAIEQEQQQRESEQQQSLAAEQATNVLIAQAETVVVEGPRIRKELRITVIESEQWAMAVVANFIKNWQHVNKYVRVKSWSKLSIGQMAEALSKHISETGEQLQGLQTKEICK